MASLAQRSEASFGQQRWDRAVPACRPVCGELVGASGFSIYLGRQTFFKP